MTHTVDITNLNAGTYSATNTIRSLDATNAPQNYVVTLKVNATDQTIVFANPGPQITTNKVGLSATASSGLAVTFATNGGPAVISGGTNLTFTSNGTVSVVATQGGNTNWNAASVTNEFTVEKATQTITFEVVATNQVVTNTVQLSASASSKLDVLFTVSGPGKITGNTNLSFTGVGPVRVFANQPGNDLWSQAPTIVRTFQVYPEAPAISGPFSTNVLSTTADLGATITATNFASVTQRGVVWSIQSGFAVTNGTRVSTNGNFGMGEFSLSVTGLAGGVTHYFKAYAVNSGGTNYTAEAEFLTCPTSPVPEAATQITTTGLVANWSRSLSATNYLLDVSTGNEFTNTVAGYSSRGMGNVTNGSVTGLTAGVEYYYRLRAQNSSGYSEFSATQSVWTVPAAPGVLTAMNNTTNSFEAQWSSAAGATNYLLDASATHDFTSTVAGYENLPVGAVLTYTVTGLTAGTEYFYRLRAENSGGLSVNSETQSVWTVPAAPEAQAATGITATNFIANWSGSLSATNYLLDVSTDE